MKHAKWIGEEGFEEWHGTDGDTPVSLHQGVKTEISDELAKRLAENFPGLIEVDGKHTSKPKPSSSEPEGSQPDGGADPETPTIDSLMKQTRVELDKQALELGVTEPEAMADKRTVAIAVLAILDDED